MTAPAATRLLDNYVGGAWTPAQAASEALDVTNPATGEVLARVPLSARGGPRRRRAAARAALPEWRAVSVIDRARYLFALREGARRARARTSRARSPPRWARRSPTRAPRWRA